MGLFDGIVGDIIGAGASLLGGSLDNSNARGQWQNEYNAQKEFAQNGIRWKVADAKAAGIHPLAALGAQTMSYSPQAVSHSNYAQTLGQMGQNIGRAIQAKFSKEEREAADLQLDNARLENEYKRAQVNYVNAQTAKLERDDVFMQAYNAERAVNSQQQVPSMPLSSRRRGSGQVAKIGSVEVVPDEVVSTSSDRTHGAGIHSDWIYSRYGNRLMVHFNESSGDSLSDDVHLGLAAKLNYLTGVKNGSIRYPDRSQWSESEKKLIDSGNYHWKFNELTFSWEVVPNRKPVTKQALRRAANRFVPGTF